MEAIELSEYIIAKHDSVGEPITNMKLQKLLYYVETWALVHIGSIIEEEFEAWIHGPVIPKVYSHYKKFGYSPISIFYPNNDPNASEFIKVFERKHIDNGINSYTFKLIADVLNEYGELNAFQLENLTHSEEPWLNARKDFLFNEQSNNIISKKEMKEYYIKLTKEDEDYGFNNTDEIIFNPYITVKDPTKITKKDLGARAQIVMEHIELGECTTIKTQEDSDRFWKQFGI